MKGSIHPFKNRSKLKNRGIEALRFDFIMFFFLFLLASVVLPQCSMGSELRIATTNDFSTFLNEVNLGANYSGTTVFLESDVSLSGITEPIGKSSGKSFLGTFDGQGHTISNLKIVSSSGYAGLFGYSSGATVKNVVLDDSCSFKSTLGSTDGYVGGIIGHCSASNWPCAIKSCMSMAKINSEWNAASVNELYIGGIIGYCSSNYEGCYISNNQYLGGIESSWNMTGVNELYIGGIAGYCNGKSAFLNNVNTGIITHKGKVWSGINYLYLGGIVGYLRSSSDCNSSVKNCANYGSITDSVESWDLYIGGIIGYSSGSYPKTVSIQNCLNHGTITNEGTTSSSSLYIGGIVGESNYCTAENCVSAGTMSSNKKGDYIGSVVGRIISQSTVSRCYWSDSINYNIYGEMYSSTISDNAKFNGDFVLNETVSVGKYTGNSLIETLNAAADYYTLRDYSPWLLNKNGNAVSFTINNKKSPLTLNSKIILLPSLESEGVLWFDGWYIDSSCTTPLTGNEIDKGTELYGKFVENHNEYTITFDTRGGTPAPEPITAWFGTVVALPSTMTMEDHTIFYWENEHGDRVTWNFTVPEHNITLYAVWVRTHITTAEDFISFSKAVNLGISFSGMTVFLDSDIEFTEGLSKEFEPIGKDYYNYFLGIFDGQGHTISNLKMNFSSEYAGLFGYLYGTTIRNVVIDESCSVETSNGAVYAYVGGIIGYCFPIKGSCVIKNIVNMGSVAFVKGCPDDLYLGGIVGYINSYYSPEYISIVKNCANYGAITCYIEDRSYIGGIAGISSNSDIQNCLNYGVIVLNVTTTRRLYVGGIVGSGYKIIENCVSAGKITSNRQDNSTFIGGIIGYGYSTGLIHSFWTSDVGYDIVNGSGAPIIDNETSQVELDSAFVSKLNEYSAKNSSWNRWLFNRNSASVSFKVNNYKGFTLNSKIVLLPDLADNSERAFSRWYNDDLLTSPFAQNEVGSNTVLYGMYCGSKYTVTLDVNGGDVSSIPASHPMFIECNGVYGEFPAPSKTGYTFLGWFTMVYGGREVKGRDTVTDFISHVLYARWEVNNYTVAFDASGGVVLQTSKNVTFDSPYGDLPVPSNTGYTFLGWFNEKTENVTKDTIVAIANNHTLTAYWAINRYTVTFEYGNGSVATNVSLEYNVTIPYPGDPLKPGYTFSGWDKDIEFMPAEDVTIAALWTANEYTVTFNPDGDVVSPTNKNVTFDSPYGDLPVPTKTGHSFVGWFDEKNESITKDTVVTSPYPHTLTAQWKEIQTTQVEIVFETKDLSEDKVKAIINGYTDADFTVVKYEDNESGVIKVIVKFNDVGAAEEFVRTVKTTSDATENKIKQIGFNSEEFDTDFSSPQCPISFIFPLIM